MKKTRLRGSAGRNGGKQIVRQKRKILVYISAWKRSFDDEGGKYWGQDTSWFLIRCSIIWRGVLSGNSTLLVKPLVRKIPLLFAASLLGAVVIKRWQGWLWSTPWLNSHCTLSSAEQGRHQQKHLVQGGFCVEIPAPGHGRFQQNYWMLDRGSRRMG